eukprot:5006396-Pyramimonas_sp.AAC.1
MTRNATTVLKNALKQASTKDSKKGAAGKAVGSGQSAACVKLALFERGVEKSKSCDVKGLSVAENSGPLNAVAAPIIVKGFEPTDIAGLLATGVAFQPKFASSK